MLKRGLMVMLLASLSCSDDGSPAMDVGIDAGGGCQGTTCTLTDQSCPDGQVVRGVDSDGLVVCVDQVSLRQQTCSGRLVVSGIRADGTVMCVDPVTSVRCGPGEVLTGIDEAGDPECESVEALVSDLVGNYVNTRCYLYFGWRDSCDGCNEPPSKVGRVRGDAMGCSVTGGNGSCATFTLFEQEIDMVSINTDGDVNDDDKFWVGFKCE